MYIFLKCFENNFKLEMLINELGRLFQYFTPIFVKRNRFLEVIDSFLINLLQYFLFLISLNCKLIGNLL